VTILDNETPYWIYRYDRPERPGKWVKMVPTESPTEIPVARWAHQVVYNPVTKVVYMHGGNARLEGEIEADVEMPPQDTAPVPEARLDEPAATTETIEEVDDAKSTRLDDFWKMSLIRYSAIILYGITYN
jgi:muskelin